MKSRLLFADRSIDPMDELDPHAGNLLTDLELGHVIAAMAHDDPFIADVARKTLFRPLVEEAEIRYRQDVLRDALAEPSIMLELHRISTGALEGTKRFWLGGASGQAESVIFNSGQVLEWYLEQLLRLRSLADQEHHFASDGLAHLMHSLLDELSSSYVEEVRQHLSHLRFARGIRLSARIGLRNEGTDYLLHLTPQVRWRDRLTWPKHDELTIQVPDRDEGGLQALGEIRARGLWLVADALDQVRQHLTNFFTNLKTESAFYLGGVQLADALRSRGADICFPEPRPCRSTQLTARGLYDPSLRLLANGPVLGNDIDADDTTLIVVTGANRGGKSTFLRSLGSAQLMMQAGLFVPAHTYSSSLHTAVFSHFKREEDASLTSGKFDEELSRMQAIVEAIAPGALLLCNESFATTNEHEGAQVAAGIIGPLREAGVRVAYVTHMFELAERFRTEAGGTALFLRAPREGSERPYTLIEGDPEPTSYAEDIYRRVFGEPLPDPTRPSAPTATH